MPQVGVAGRPFPPLQGNPQAVTAAGLLAADPREHGHPQTRWTLAALRATVSRFAGASLSGIWRVLAACKLRWRRGRDHLHSPDPDYQRKRDRLRTIEAHVAEHPTSAELFYLDEVTYYHQPSLAAAYALASSATPLAERSTRGNTTTRVLAALDAHSGQVVSLQATRIGVPALLRFFKALVAAYPGRRLYIVLDNWPVHFPPDLLPLAQPHRDALALAQARRPSSPPSRPPPLRPARPRPRLPRPLSEPLP